ncbi:copper resistance protein B [Acinetobacter sp. A47]|uniref:copper resistance protein B n=1 Tax=Acinetobacter sp. A47 TaxID=1561217 RepID=UPI00056E247E|nr:copper resistance protein B [Acinetobacter sp. A47]
MHITKLSLKMKRYTQLLAMGGMVSSLSAFAYAHEGHDQMMQMEMPAQQHMPVASASSMDHSQHQRQTTVQQPSQTSLGQHDHSREHGGQIYQSTQLDSAWLLDENGKGSVKSKLKTWVGSDENKLFINADYAKTESEKSEQRIAALYSRNISDFWDVQAGVNYRYNAEHQSDKEQFEGVVGVHGMAQYFFETDAHLYAGEDQQWRFVLETERDFLLTQQLIMQPYLEMEWVLRDQSRYAAKTGLAAAEVGIKTRYEVVKNRVMPFIDVAYGYNKGRKATDWQQATDSKTGWVYGAGLTLKF